MAGEKGLSDLIEATRQMVDAQRDVRLVLIGDGPARRSVERTLQRLPSERIEDYGYVGDRQFYMDVLRGGDVFAHPSHAEGVPKAVIEAMAAGLPVVAAAAGAVREILDDGRRGRVVPAGDPDALAAAMGELLDDPSATAATRALALDWASAHTAEAQAERLVGRVRSLFPKLAWAVPVDR
jgi:glycosyltransferase involved in cell wall biosynthesis